MVAPKKLVAELDEHPRGVREPDSPGASGRSHPGAVELFDEAGAECMVCTTESP